MSKMTEQDVNLAHFLLGWAKKKQITHMGGDTTFHKSGKLMTKIPPESVKMLHDNGLVTGSTSSFVMNKDAVKALA